MARHIGLLFGHETELPEALLARLSTEPGITASPVRIGGISDRAICRWDVILDRFSHRVPHYRHMLKAAALAGTTVINDPFWQAADDRFLALSLAARLGVAVPRMALLPQHSYGAGVVHDRSLHNIEHPLPWHDIADFVKLPALLRFCDAGLDEAREVADLGGLWAAFDRSGERPTMLQQHIRDMVQVNVICVDFEHVLAREGELPASAVEASQRVSRALGYRLNALTWRVGGGGAWLVDASDPQPRLDAQALGRQAFADVVELLAQALIRAAHGGERTRDAYRWAREIA